MARKKYITDEEIETLTSLIYNDTIQTYYKDDVDTPKVDYTGILEEVSLKGEEWYPLNEHNEAHYFLSTYGRCFNAQRVTFVKPHVFKEYSAVLIRKVKTNIIQFLDEQGVTASYLEILKGFKQREEQMIETFNSIEERISYLTEHGE